MELKFGFDIFRFSVCDSNSSLRKIFDEYLTFELINFEVKFKVNGHYSWSMMLSNWRIHTLHERSNSITFEKLKLGDQKELCDGWCVKLSGQGIKKWMYLEPNSGALAEILSLILSKWSYIKLDGEIIHCENILNGLSV